jgi:hypothetical protein
MGRARASQQRTFVFQFVAQTWSSPLLRRAIAMLCVLALLTVAVGHNCEHLGPGTAQASLSLTADHTPDDTSPTDTAVVVDHCPVCCSAWFPATFAAVAPTVPAGETIVRNATLLRVLVPPAETPPPIA